MINHQHTKRFGLQRVLDAFIITSVLLLAMNYFHETDLHNQYVRAGLSGLLLYLSISMFSKIYVEWPSDSLRIIWTQTVILWIVCVLLMIGGGFFTKTSALYSRVVMGVWFVVTPVLLCAARLVSLQLLIIGLGWGRDVRKFAIAGRSKLSYDLLDKINRSPWLGLQFAGFFDDRAQDRLGHEPVSGREFTINQFDELVRLAKQGEIDAVYVTLPMKAEGRIVNLLNQLADTTASVYFVPNFFVFEMLQGRMMNLDGIPLVSLHETPFLGVGGILKRAEDIVLSSIILMLLAIPLCFIAIGVKLSSPGPVIFKQRRYGLNGAVIDIWKFRSMRAMDNGPVVQQAQKDDPRFTKFGRFIRKTSVDEFPQFVNVLMGSMSIVGPRPHAVAHNEQYRSLLKGYMLRHKVKPGITGWAQINGWRGETETLDKMAMRLKFDLEYIQNWSFWLDIKIIFLTIFKGFVGKDVY